MNDMPFDGLEFVFSGQLEHLSRAEAQEAVRSRGGVVVGRVGTSTTYVVVGATPGKRRSHGKLLGAEELDEKQFMDMLRY